MPVPAPATLDDLLGSGVGLHTALVRRVRDLIADKHIDEALSIGFSLAKDEATAELGSMLLGVVHETTARADLAWADFAQISDPALASVSADEYFAAGYATDAAAAATMLRRIIDAGLQRSWKGTRLMRVAQRAFIHGDLDLARALTDDGLSRSDTSVSALRRASLQRLTTWYPDGERTQPVEVLPSDLRFGVLNYKQPDNSSRNVGDWVQTIASLGHLVRHRNLSFVGTDPELVGFVQQLAADTKPERYITDSPSATVQLVELQRDATPFQQLPDPTWAFIFGWFMHETFGLTYNFPLHENVRPIFISFHLNRTDMLDDATVEYLTRYGPVGCRDWQSVVALHNAGVPAFFSGCLTTTVDTVFQPGDPQARVKVGFIDHFGDMDEGAENIEQSIGDIRNRSFAENLRLAHGWLNDYNTIYRKIYTSRLHSNLPSRSLGCEVVFEPKNRADVRFGGLIDLDDAAFEAIRSGIRDKLAAIMAHILRGESDEQVYSAWRDLCADDVAHAHAYLDSFEFDDVPALDIPALLPGVDDVVVVSLYHGEADQVPTLLQQIAQRATANMGVVFAGHEATKLDAQALTARFGLPVSVCTDRTVDLDALGKRVKREERLQREVLTALALAAAPDAGRIVVLPLATLLRIDLNDLFSYDLEGQPLAARTDPFRGRNFGPALARRISGRQGEPLKALGFLAAAARGTAPRYRPFDATVLVVDPAALRAAAAPGRLAGLMGAYGMTLREALNVTLGERRTELPGRFNVMPRFETPGSDVAVVDYRPGAKPWDTTFVPRRGEWRKAAKAAQRSE